MEICTNLGGDWSSSALDARCCGYDCSAGEASSLIVFVRHRIIQDGGIAEFAGKGEFSAGENVVGLIERKSMVRRKYA